MAENDEKKYDIDVSVDTEAIACSLSVKAAIARLLKVVSNQIKSVQPAIVTDYNRLTGMVKVKPLALFTYMDVNGEIKTSDTKEIELHSLQMSYGGITVDWGYYKGDTGWMVAGDFDNSKIRMNRMFFENGANYLGSNSEKVRTAYLNAISGLIAETAVVHKYEYGFFIPHNWCEYNLDNVKDLIKEEDKPFEEDELLYIGSSVPNDSDIGGTDYKEIPSCHLSLLNGKEEEDESKIVIASSGDRYEYGKKNDKTNVRFLTESLELHQDSTAVGGNHKIEIGILFGEKDEDDERITFKDESDSVTREFEVNRHGIFKASGKGNGGELYIGYDSDDEAFELRTKKSIIELGYDKMSVMGDSEWIKSDFKKFILKLGKSVTEMSGNVSMSLSGTVNISQVMVLSANKIKINGSVTVEGDASISCGRDPKTGDLLLKCPGKVMR